MSYTREQGAGAALRIYPHTIAQDTLTTIDQLLLPGDSGRLSEWGRDNGEVFKHASIGPLCDSLYTRLKRAIARWEKEEP